MSPATSPDLENSQEVAWSFDLKSLHRDVDGDRDLETIIRGHLYIEHVLITYLREALTRPDAIQLDRVSFPLKVELGVALGVISPSMVEALKRVNGLRNKVAHNLQHEVTEDDKKSLIDLLPPHGKDILLLDETLKPVDQSLITLGRVLKVIVILSDLDRQGYVRWKAQRNEAFENARKLLDELKAKDVQNGDGKSEVTSQDDD